MNKSIWTKEINTGLYLLLNEHPLSDGRKCRVVFKYPDIDYDSEELTYPLIQIVSLSETFDDDRYDHNNPEVVVSTDGVNVVKEELAKPFKILYYIEPITAFQEDMDELTLYLNHLFGKFHNLEVLTANDEPATVQMVRGTSVPQLEMDTRKKRRLFKKTLVFHISGFVDFGETSTKNVIIQTVIEEVPNE